MINAKWPDATEHEAKIYDARSQATRSDTVIPDPRAASTYRLVKTADADVIRQIMRYLWLNTKVITQTH